MARWFKEHLGFKTTKAPPPAPPKPDYRHFQTAVCAPPAASPLQQQPDILTAYKLQKDLDFEDPYTPGGNASFTGSLGSSAGATEVRFGSPIHRLIKVEAAERSASSTGSSSGVNAVKTPTSPPAEPDNSGGKADKVSHESSVLTITLFNTHKHGARQLRGKADKSQNSSIL